MAKISAWPNASDYLRETIRTQVARIADLEHVRAEADEVHRKQVARIAALEREVRVLEGEMRQARDMIDSRDSLIAELKREGEGLRDYWRESETIRLMDAGAPPQDYLDHAAELTAYRKRDEAIERIKAIDAAQGGE